MRSKTSERFRALFAALSSDAQRQARAAYRLFRDNPRHGSLQFKRVSPSDPSLYSVRVGMRHRAIGILDGDTVTWIWIGTHEEYNAIIRKR